MKLTDTWRRSCRGILLGLLIAGCGDEDNGSPQPAESLLTLADAANLVFEQKGGQLEFQLTANRVWAVASPGGEWLEVAEDSRSGDAGTAKIKLLAGENTATQPRRAELLVTAGRSRDTVKVTQLGMQPVILVSDKMRRGIPCDGTTLSIVVNSNISPLDMKCDQGWLHVQAPVFQAVSYMYELTVDRNEGGERTGYVIFTGGNTSDTLTIVQNAHQDIYQETGARLNTGAMQGSAFLEFLVNAPWRIHFPEGQPGWITGVEPAAGEAMKQVKVVFTTEQNTGDARSCGFQLIYGKSVRTFTLTQAEAVVSENGTRETDSIALAKVYHRLRANGSDISWDLESPMNKWGTGSVTLNASGRVIKLRLGNAARLKGAIPADLCGLYYLMDLKIDGYLDHLVMPEGMGNLKYLQKLQIISYSADENAICTLTDMSGCTALEEIAFWGFRMMESAKLCGLTAVKDVRYQNLAIGSGAADEQHPFPSVKNWPHLENFYANSVNANNFPEGLGDCSKLKSVTVINCKYMTCGLPDFFTRTAIYEADLANNRLSGEVPDYVFESNTLTNCYLSGNQLEGDLSVKICDSKIQRISLRDNMMGGVGHLLDERILNDKRWVTSGTGEGSEILVTGWGGAESICPQKSGFGWDNCPAQ